MVASSVSALKQVCFFGKGKKIPPPCGDTNERCLLLLEFDLCQPCILIKRVDLLTWVQGRPACVSSLLLRSIMSSKKEAEYCGSRVRCCCTLIVTVVEMIMMMMMVFLLATIIDCACVQGHLHIYTHLHTLACRIGLVSW